MKLNFIEQMRVDDMEPSISIGHELEGDGEAYININGFINEKEAKHIIDELQNRFCLKDDYFKMERFGA